MGPSERVPDVLQAPQVGVANSQRPVRCEAGWSSRPSARSVALNAVVNAAHHWCQPHTPGRSQSPRRRYTGRADSSVTADEGYVEEQGGGSDDTVRHVRNVASSHFREPGRYMAVERYLGQHRVRFVEMAKQPGQGAHRHSPLLLQVHDFRERDGGDCNLIVSCSRCRKGCPCCCRQSSIIEDVPNHGVRVGDRQDHSNTCSRGERPHASRRAPSISSAEGASPRSAVIPRTDRAGSSSLAIHVPNRVDMSR
jgi:hypothetical protein